MMSGSGKIWAEGAKLLQLALSMYRNPADAATSVPDAELPDAMQILLRVANNDAELLTWAKAATGVDADVLNRSCIAFIERIFFAGAAEPYRILGLNPWATPADVKEHYRLLIRIFHPDRGCVDRASAETYAAMINQAYAALKTLTSTYPLHDVDRHMTAFATAQAARSVRLPYRIPKLVPLAGAGFGSWRCFARLTPPKALGSIAAIASLIVVVMFLQENRAGVSRYDAAAESSMEVSAFPDMVEPQPKGRYARPMPEPHGQLASVPVLSQFSAEAPVLTMRREIVQSPNIAVAASVPLRMKAQSGDNVHSVCPLSSDGHLKGLPLAEKRAEPIEPASAAASTEVAGMASVGDGGDTDTSHRTPAPAPKASSTLKVQDAPSELELHHLVAQFMGSYNRGDLSSFMSVFDENVRTDEAGGKVGLQNTYERFFSSTLSRGMVFKDMHWQHSGELAIGLADYRVSISRSDDTAPRSSTGTLRFEVARTDAGVMIVGFFHQAASK